MKVKSRERFGWQRPEEIMIVTPAEAAAMAATITAAEKKRGRPDNTKRGRTKHLTQEQLDRFFTEAKKESAEDYLLLKLCFAFGLRVTEAIRLTRDSVLRDEHRLVVLALKNGNDTAHLVPPDIWARLMKHLQTLPADEHCLFAARSASKSPYMSAQSAKQLFYRVAIRAGLTGFSIHSLRASYAQSLANAGANTQHIAGMMRHKDPRSSLRYTESIVDEAVEAMHLKIMKRYAR